MVDEYWDQKGLPFPRESVVADNGSGNLTLDDKCWTDLIRD